MIQALIAIPAARITLIDLVDYTTIETVSLLGIKERTEALLSRMRQVLDARMIANTQKDSWMTRGSISEWAVIRPPLFIIG